MDEAPNFQVMSLQHGGEPGHLRLRTRRYQIRKTHAKSRAGCLGCKVKRVKCDEGKPTCRRCQRNRAPCIYREPGESSPSSDLVLSQEIVYASQLPLPEHRGRDATACGTPRSILLHHFCIAFEEVYGIGDGGPGDFIALGLARPYLLDVILAISACHLRHYAVSSSAYRVAEHYQQGLALRGFQAALCQPLDQQGADALLLTSMMLNLLSFPLAGHERDAGPEASWVFSADAQRCSWMTLSMGMKPLLIATAAFRQESALGWMYEASDDEAHSFSTDGLPLDHVPASWKAFFELEESSSVSENMLYEPVRILALLKPLPPRVDFFFLYLSFFGKLDMEFRTLVEKQDEKALWLLGFWFGLLRRFDFWWMRNRVSRDHEAVIRWFKTHCEKRCGTSDHAIWRQLLHDLELAPHYDGATISSCFE